MGEREPFKECIQRGDIYLLIHPGAEGIFSGYGLATTSGRNDALVGLLMVDRPYKVDPSWLNRVEEVFGEYQLVPMAASGERGILCRMQIDIDSIQHLQKYPFENTNTVQQALLPLLDSPPKPVFKMFWDPEHYLWRSQIQYPNELPEELKAMLKKTGYGCLAAEADIGVVHVCHAPDIDIVGFVEKPVISRWQLIKMPNAPLIRLELIIIDNPVNPFRFESFLNVAEEDQAFILAQLANQESLYLAFYGDDLEYKYTKSIPHDFQQWQLLDEFTEEAKCYWESIPQEEQDFDKAKAIFISNN